MGSPRRLWREGGALRRSEGLPEQTVHHGRVEEDGSMKLNNRWVQLGASLVAMIMIANLQYSWTLFVKPIQAATGWKLSEISAAFTLFILFQTWVQPLDGWLIDRLGPRIFFTVGAILFGTGWTALGFVTTLTQLYAAY